MKFQKIAAAGAAEVIVPVPHVACAETDVLQKVVVLRRSLVLSEGSLNREGPPGGAEPGPR